MRQPAVKRASTDPFPDCHIGATMLACTYKPMIGRAITAKGAGEHDFRGVDRVEGNARTGWLGS